MKEKFICLNPICEKQFKKEIKKPTKEIRCPKCNWRCEAKTVSGYMFL